jgi:ATP-dependent helicase/nuclease subunit A
MISQQMGSAAHAQLAASDPRASVFVSAHAGTGKTKVLVDRLVRLMLEGADPARILCLTYTKAAAAEMAIRLQQRLGRWVTMEDARLEAELAALEVAPGKRQRARELFAHVLDLPGGMRIGTIHAFCQSLLKRFPLEAQISPHFQVAEEMEKRADLEEARETVLPGANVDALARLAGLVNAEGFAGLASVLETERARLEIALGLSTDALEMAIRRVAGVTSADEASALEACVSWAGEGALRAALRIADVQGSDSVREKASRMLAWLSLPEDLRAEHFGEWRREFLLDSGEPRGPGIFANKRLSEKHPQITPLCVAEQQRLMAVLDEQRAHRMAAATAALLCVAGPILATYAQGKERRALLDYADLITRSFKLLDDEAIGAAWVLFKLDGGLDHLLLDEVQDTAPEQWAIADRLTADFFVGEGAREGASLARTVFAVGDRKQSIYSFQGADPEEFDRWREIYGRRVTGAGLTWRRGDLTTSFRSTEPVLRLVDAVFSDPAAAEGVCEAGEPALRHVAHRQGQAGRIELWPLAPRPEKPAHKPWAVPGSNQLEISAPQTLVNELARWIAEQTGGGTVLHSEGRALRPGDILVLVRRRSAFASALVRALKAKGVAVAGLDRMVLTEQPAVQDILSLCHALLLPQDDLSLAEMLVSPLGGLSDDSLMALAMERQGSLWEALRRRAGERPDWAAAHIFFAALLGRVDFAAPHALLVEALGPLGGRARLFARLGPEAAEPIDELLTAALQHASVHPPSLQGFVHWLLLSAAEVKREAEAAGDSVRVMTVHGSKGLEAPVVILPDTTSLPPEDRGLSWAQDDETGAHLPLWQPNRELRCSAADQLRQVQAEKRAREYNRLLYVALTRARDRLVICGWEAGRPQPGTWYEKVERGMLALGAATQDFAAWPGQLKLIETRQMALAEETRAASGGAAVALPAWAGCAPSWKPAALAPEPVLPRPLAPSRPEGVELGPVPPSRSPLAAGGQRDRFARGLAMHALLQHLPDVPDAAQAQAALAYAARPALGINAPEDLARQALGVLRAPELAALFGPGSRAEQPISGVVGSLVVTGQVDRLAVLADRVLIADYKTRAAPERPADVPVLYLRQMAAYRAVLEKLYPDRPVYCVLIWTDGAEITVLPDALLDRHAPGAPASLQPA